MLDRQSLLSYDYLAGECKKKHAITDLKFSLKFFHGHEEILPESIVPWPEKDVFIKSTISLAGGKGGFGSMLRAIGAQIEKTTNREACRDLSGRRLRDINEEKRLKDWVSKQADREREREERKKKKLDKLREEYHHKFEDPEYYKARSEVTDKVHEALEQGIQASTSTEPPKKKIKSSNSGPAMKKTALWVGVSDDDGSDSGSDSGSGSEIKNKPEMTDNSNEKESSQVLTADAQSSKQETSEDTNCQEKTVEPFVAPAIELLVEKNSPAIDNISMTKSVLPPSELEIFTPIDLDDFNSCQELENLGLNHLKNELQNRGLKCGGTLSERASRLFSIKGVASNEIDPNLLAKPPKKK
nr:EOG090X0OE5 [Eurycercus lamellatus]